MSTPLLAYYIEESQDNNLAQILRFFKSKHIKIPDYLEPHADTKTGLNPASKTKVKRALDSALEEGKITQDEYDKYTYKINFTGSDDNNPLAKIATETTDHKIPMSELPENASYEELMNVDISLPPDLQAIADMPIVSSDPDLMSDIMAVLPEGM